MVVIASAFSVWSTTARRILILAHDFQEFDVNYALITIIYRSRTT
jgi:hypothetical protein